MAVDRIEPDELLALRAAAAVIDLSSRRRVMTELAGSRVSGFRGRGLDFDEHRLYQPGDEARSIDWRVTARTGRAHVRVYREERERPMLLAVDLRRAMWFGTRGCFKAVQAARAAALCAWAAADNGDRVGGLVFGAGPHAEVRPRAGVTGVLRLLHALPRSAPAASPTPDGELTAALQRLLHMTRPGSLVAMFSDCRGLQGSDRNLLARLARRAELVLGFVHDPLEAELPPPGVYPLAGRAGAATTLLATRDPARRAAWREAFAARRAAAQQVARAHGAHWLDLSTAQPLLPAIQQAFGRSRRSA